MSKKFGSTAVASSPPVIVHPSPVLQVVETPNARVTVLAPPSSSGSLAGGISLHTTAPPTTTIVEDVTDNGPSGDDDDTDGAAAAVPVVVAPPPEPKKKKAPVKRPLLPDTPAAVKVQSTLPIPEDLTTEEERGKFINDSTRAIMAGNIYGPNDIRSADCVKRVFPTALKQIDQGFGNAVPTMFSAEVPGAENFVFVPTHVKGAVKVLVKKPNGEVKFEPLLYVTAGITHPGERGWGLRTNDCYVAAGHHRINPKTGMPEDPRLYREETYFVPSFVESAKQASAKAAVKQPRKKKAIESTTNGKPVAAEVTLAVPATEEDDE